MGKRRREEGAKCIVSQSLSTGKRVRFRVGALTLRSTLLANGVYDAVLPTTNTTLCSRSGEDLLSLRNRKSEGRQLAAMVERLGTPKAGSDARGRPLGACLKTADNCECSVRIPGAKSAPGWSAGVRSQLTATSASQAAGTTGVQHHARRIFVFLVETVFPRVGQAGLKLLTSGDSPALGSQSAGITDGVSLCPPGWRAVAQSLLTVASTSRVQAILLPQSPDNGSKSPNEHHILKPSMSAIMEHGFLSSENFLKALNTLGTSLCKAMTLI
ncbi:hypothetical protein AAY473_011777 [Plecturocebus cupreus]